MLSSRFVLSRLVRSTPLALRTISFSSGVLGVVPRADNRRWNLLSRKFTTITEKDPGAGEKTRAVWKEKWDSDQAGWHKVNVDERLKKYLKDLTWGKPGVPILVTWCGKSLDLPWLCEKGYDVVGTELSETAAKAMFEEHSIPYSVSTVGEFLLYQATDRKLRYYVGNFYNLTPDIAGKFGSVWDMNAFGACEPRDRNAYVKVLASLLNPKGRILLSNFEFGNEERVDAPFNLPRDLVEKSFQDYFDVQFLDNPDEFETYFIEKYGVDWVTHHIHLLTLK